VVRALRPQVLLSTHAKPVIGAQRIQESLTLYLDGVQYIFDQTLRGALQGRGPDELREFVRLPAHLAAFPNLSESYGQIDWYAPYIYEHALGWFSGDAASLNPLPPKGRGAEDRRRLRRSRQGAGASAPSPRSARTRVGRCSLRTICTASTRRMPRRAS
jgi:alkyl sulfatase BDS1-like metallo-beta-lactamase superfamily hydrolase